LAQAPNRWWGHLWPSTLIIALVAAASVGLNADVRSYPRFDGSGYAVLAEALMTGQGYREIDHPERPRHAHFPPGYPMVLAGLWALTGRSFVASHVLSWVETTLAALAFWWWFRRLYRPHAALMLGLAVAVNWTWGRIGGEIQSEPQFLFLQSLVLVVALRVRWLGGLAGGVVLGLLLGACALTRHVGITLALAVALDLWLSQRRAALVGMGCAFSATILPWIVWLAQVQHNTQASLLFQRGLRERIAGLALFYLRRIPDQVTGPVVEVGTVFRNSPTLAGALTVWAAVAAAVVVLGWLRALGSRRRRLAGLVPVVTMALLLVWPFTEAGRFLIPVLPFVLAGGMEGLGVIGAWVGRLVGMRWAQQRSGSLPTPAYQGGEPEGGALLGKGAIEGGHRAATARVAGAWIALLVSIPYSGYAILTGRSEALRQTHRDFDAACAWIRHDATRPGRILTRHPGEVYVRTGRQALAPPADDPGVIDQTIVRYRVAYLLIDEERYARSPANPLGGYLRRRPGYVKIVWSRGGAASSVSIAEVAP
jgi:hypothetical protein